MLQCPSSVIKPHLQLIIAAIEWLINIQDPDGNWPHKASTRPNPTTAEDMVQ
jgi:hypothetical protein